MGNSYKYLAAGRDKPYYVNNHSDSTKQFSETDIFKMLEFLIDNTFAMIGGHVFQQTDNSYGYQLCSSARVC